MNYLIEKTKNFYLNNKEKVNNYLMYGCGFSLLYYNPYLFLNGVIFILVFNHINVELRIQSENTFKIPEFNINGNFSVDQTLNNEIKIQPPLENNEIIDDYLSDNKTNNQLENSAMYESVIYNSDSDTEDLSHIKWKK